MTAVSALCVYEEYQPDKIWGNDYVGSATGTIVCTRHSIGNPFSDTIEDYTYPHLDEFIGTSLSKIYFDTSDLVPDLEDFIKIMDSWFYWPNTKDSDPLIFVGDHIKITKKEIQKVPVKDIWDKLKGKRTDG